MGRSAKAKAAEHSAASATARRTPEAAFMGQALKKARKRVMDLLNEKPEQVLPCLHALETDFFAKQAAGASECFPDTYARFNQVPKYWLTAWLMTVVPGLSAETLNNIDGYCKDSLRRIVDFACGTTATGKLPRQCLSKRVLSLTLTQRYKDLGSRLGGSWFSDFVTPEGTIDWVKGGAFRFKATENGEVQQVVHVGGQEVSLKDQGAQVRQDWGIENNWSDKLAYTQHGIVVINFATKLFNEQVRNQVSYEAFQDAAKAAADKDSAKQKELQVGTITEDPSVITPKKRSAAAPPPSAPPKAAKVQVAKASS